MASNISYEEFCELTRVQSKKEKEIIKLKNQLSEINEKYSKLGYELAKYKRLFDLGWKESESQWRLPKEVALSIVNE